MTLLGKVKNGDQKRLQDFEEPFPFQSSSIRHTDKRMPKIKRADIVHMIKFKGFNQKWLEDVFTLRSDRLCDHYGHSDLATDRARCLHTLRKGGEKTIKNKEYVLYWSIYNNETNCK